MIVVLEKFQQPSTFFQNHKTLKYYNISSSGKI